MVVPCCKLNALLSRRLTIAPLILSLILVSAITPENESEALIIQELESEALIIPENESEGLIKKHIDSIIELKEAGIDFYTKTLKETTTSAGVGCLLGGMTGATAGLLTGMVPGMVYGGAQGCAGMAFLSSLVQAINAPFKHWSQSMKAAYRARKAYIVSFQWLQIEAYEIFGSDELDLETSAVVVKKKYRECAKRYHPDVIPQTAKEEHKASAKRKLENCLFAKHFILAFQKRYGLLDPEDSKVNSGAKRQFLIDFAGAWASTFGANEGPGGLSDEQVMEWMLEAKYHNDL